MNFAIIGVSGFIAPKHLRAIKELGHQLVVAFDLSDSAGVLDSFFPNSEFFIDTQDFKNHILSLKGTSHEIDYVSICSPNHYHKEHIELAIECGANVICEKPLVLNPKDLDYLINLEIESGKKIYTILQLRLHPEVVKLKKYIRSEEFHDVMMNIYSPRGKWYHKSWKGDGKKSGGIVTNIGIHYFDLLMYLFGEVFESSITSSSTSVINGELVFKTAKVKWELDISCSKSFKPIRFFKVNGLHLNLNDQINLHSLSYAQILNQHGFEIETVSPAINLTHNINLQL